MFQTEVIPTQNKKKGKNIDLGSWTDSSLVNSKPHKYLIFFSSSAVSPVLASTPWYSNISVVGFSYFRGDPPKDQVVLSKNAYSRHVRHHTCSGLLLKLGYDSYTIGIKKENNNLSLGAVLQS